MNWALFVLAAVLVAIGVGSENVNIAIMGLSLKLTAIFFELTERRP